MKLGARIFKTGIAIALSIFLASWLDMPAPVFAGIAAVFAMQPSIYRSYLSVIEQVQANVIGAFFAIIFVLIFGNSPYVIGLAAIVVIVINLRLKIESTIPIALVTVIAIMENPGENFVQFAIIRFTTIMLGVLSAFVVNLAFLPPRYETKLYYKIADNTEEIIKWIRMNIRHASDHQMLKETIEQIKENMIKLDQLYLLYKEERDYFRRNKFGKSRKLVLFRQMIITTNRALETLKKLHRFENEVQQTPKEFQQMIASELDVLLAYHEQIMLKFIDKVKTNQSNDISEKLCVGKKSLMDAFLKYHSENEPDNPNYSYQLFSLISSIIDYSEQLDHLDKLIDTFKSFHKGENELDIEEKED
jgi:uncharacterized membrane protein YgaE (UPF0421/DUF939 family)